MKLYLVRFTNEDGFNMDLFVIADSPEEAIKLWRKWDYPDEDDDPWWVREIPAKVEGPARFLSWEDIPMVYDRPEAY